MRTRLSATMALLAGASVAALAGGTIGAAAALSTELTIQNHLSLDTVDIRIDQVQPTTKTLVAGESYPHSALISNLGADCYLRVLVRAQSGSRSSTLATKEGLDENDWILAGNYLYYRPVLEEGQQVDFRQSIFNPWDDISGPPQPMSLSITAEAVQARNFNPDYESSTPWGSIEVEECVRSRKQVTTANAGSAITQGETSPQEGSN